MPAQKKGMTIAGWVIATLIALAMTFSAAMKFLYPPEMAEQFTGKFGYPDKLAFILGIVELSCVVIFISPRTSVLGAVLLTGYLGGAVATHVRVSDAFIAPVIVGIFVWLSLYLRDPRVRELLPILKTPARSPPA